MFPENNFDPVQANIQNERYARQNVIDQLIRLAQHTGKSFTVDELITEGRKLHEFIQHGG